MIGSSPVISIMVTNSDTFALFREYFAGEVAGIGSGLAGKIPRSRSRSAVSKYLLNN